MPDGKDELISIIIPVYNVANDLDRCIRSVAGQTYRNMEILLIDDGSTDGSGDICETYADGDGRIQVYHKENGGLSSARNFGIRKAAGNVFAFVDSDDCIHNRMIEILYRNLCDENADISVGEYRRVEKNSAVVQEAVSGITAARSSAEALALLLGRDPMYNTGVVCNKLFRRKVFEGVEFPEGRLHEDEFVIHLLFGNAGRIVYTSDILYYYFVREESITGSYSKKRLDALDAYEERFRYYERKGLSDLASAGFRRYLYIVRVNYHAYKRWYPGESDVLMQLRARHAVQQSGYRRTAPMRLFDRSPTLYFLVNGMLKLGRGRSYIWE